MVWVDCDEPTSARSELDFTRFIGAIRTRYGWRFGPRHRRRRKAARGWDGLGTQPAISASGLRSLVPRLAPIHDRPLALHDQPAVGTVLTTSAPDQ